MAGDGGHTRAPGFARQAVGLFSSSRSLFRFCFDSGAEEVLARLGRHLPSLPPGGADEQSLQVGVQVRPPTISPSMAGHYFSEV
jgi:hypothetical protein